MTGGSLVLDASVLDRKRAPDVWPEDLHHQGSEADGWLHTVRFDRHRAPGSDKINIGPVGGGLDVLTEQIGRAALEFWLSWVARFG